MEHTELPVELRFDASDAEFQGEVAILDAELDGMVEGETVEGWENTSPSIGALTDAFFDDVGLAPARTLELTGETREFLARAAADGSPEAFRRAQKLLSELSVAQELQAAAVAKNTRRTYGWQARAFIAWCERWGRCALPATAETVASHLAHFAVLRDEAGEAIRGPEGQLLPAVSTGSVGVRVAAINKLHEYAGFPKPGDSKQVRDVLRGIRRTFLVAARYRKQALDMNGLRAVLAVVRQERLLNARLRVLVLLRAYLGLSAGQLTQLCWADVQFLEPEAEDNVARVELSLSGLTGGVKPPEWLWASKARGWRRRVQWDRAERVVVLPERLGLLCPVKALRDLYAVSGVNQELFSDERGRPLTRQALHVAGARIASRAALENGWSVLAGASDEQLLAVLADERCASESTKSLRDAALLLTGGGTPRCGAAIWSPSAGGT